jgi:hypothetical protein
MSTPRATYRLQFSPAFGFEACQGILDYLAALGVSHLYASPIFKSRPGSTHGYDVCDYQVINPELGGEEGFRPWRRSQGQGPGLIRDQPNHMAFGRPACSRRAGKRPGLPVLPLLTSTGITPAGIDADIIRRRGAPAPTLEKRNGRLMAGFA